MRWKTCAMALASAALLWPTTGSADEMPAESEAQFKAPKRVFAGGKLAGEGRLYPSPVMQDMNGDGKADLVIADLFGHVTVAHATENGFGPEEKLLGRDGKALKFDNW